MSTASKRRRKLDEIYADLPAVACKGLCWNACAAIPVHAGELERLEFAAKRKLPVVHEIGRTLVIAASATKLECPLLVVRRCSAYTDRPFICRIFGVADGLPCPHGCVPDRVLSVKEIEGKLRQLEKV